MRSIELSQLGACAAILSLTLPAQWLHLLKLLGVGDLDLVVVSAVPGQLAKIHLVTLSDSVDFLVHFGSAMVTLLTSYSVLDPAGMPSSNTSDLNTTFVKNYAHRFL